MDLAIPSASLVLILTTAVPGADVSAIILIDVVIVAGDIRSLAIADGCPTVTIPIVTTDAGIVILGDCIVIAGDDGSLDAIIDDSLVCTRWEGEGDRCQNADNGNEV